MLSRHILGDKNSGCSFEVEGTRLRVSMERSQFSFIAIRAILLVFLVFTVSFSWNGIRDFGPAALEGDPMLIVFASVWILFTGIFIFPLIFVFCLPRLLSMEFDVEHGLSTPHWILRRWAGGKKGLVLDIDIYPVPLQGATEGELRGGFLARPAISDTKRGFMGLRRRRLKKFFPLSMSSMHFSSPSEALRVARKLKRFLRKHRLPIPVLIKRHSTPYRTD